MPVEQYSLVANDWLNLEFIINDLTQRVVGQELHPTSAPTFADLTLTGDLNITGDLDIGGTLTLDALTASRLVATDASKGLESSDLFGWVAGTTDHISVADDSDGTVTLDLDTNTKTLLGSFNGIFLEKLDFTISEAAGTVTGSLEQDSGGDLIQRFSDGYTTLDCTPALTIDLTAYVGTNAVPKVVFVYILQSAKTVMAASNSDWPATEHCKVARLILKSAATTGTDGGALGNQNWNDYAVAPNGEGHLAHVEQRLRQEPAAHDEGVALTLKNAAGAGLTTGNSSTAVEIVTAVGKVYQLHRHTFPAFDMYTTATDDAHIVNQPTNEGGAYVTTADLVADITHYVDGTAAGVVIGTNKYFNLVVWGIQNRSGETSHIMINLPTGQYTTSANAVADVDGISIFEIPSAFKDIGFLIARLTFRLIGGSQWTYIAQEDLRGKFPDIIAGVGITTTDHALLANLIAPADDHTQYLLADGTRALAGAWDMGNQALTNVNIDSGDINVAVVNTEWDAAYAHVSNDGSDHSFIDQDVTITGTPQFARIGLGTAAHASVPLHISDGNAVDAALITSVYGLISAYNVSPGFSIVSAGPDVDDRAVFQGVRCDGTLASPTVPAGNDKVLSFLGSIYDGVNLEGTAAVDFFVDGNVSENVAPQRISFSTSATNAASRAEKMTIRSNGKVGIGTTTLPHGGIGAALFALDGTNASIQGPHIQFTTASNDYPVLQILNWAHDNISLNFDSYFDGAWKSSDAGSSFSIIKTIDTLRFKYDVAAVGGAITWNDGIIMNNVGAVQINGTLSSGVITQSGTTLANTYHPKTTVGIADNNLVEMDDADAADNDYAKFTANGLEGRSYAETKTDLSLNLVENTALSTWAGTTNITTLGTIATGAWAGTTIPINKGGTGQVTAQLAINALTAVSGATNEHVLTKDTGTGNAIWKAAGGGVAAHAILDGSVHTDSVADAVTRGSIIYGNATPKWDELGLGLVNTFLGSDGTDLSYRTAAQVMASLSDSATAAFDLNGQDLTNGGVLFLTEQAAAEANVAGKGQFWVLNNTPNEPWFDNDAGTSFSLDNRMADRGDPANWDWTEATLTTNETWVNLDLSGIVPVNTKFVWFTGYLRDDAVESYFQIRREGNSNTRTAFTMSTRVANVVEYFTSMGPVPVDANRLVEYRASNTTFTDIKVAVSTWVLG